MEPALSRRWPGYRPGRRGEIVPETRGAIGTVRYGAGGLIGTDRP